MTWVDAVFWITLAICGGLGLIAWERPSGYARLGRSIFWGMCALTAYVATYLFGIYSGVMLVQAQMKIGTDGYYTIYGVSPVLIVVSMVALSAYLGFLLYLPKLMQEDEPPER